MNWEWNCHGCGCQFQTADTVTTPSCPNCNSSDVVRLVLVTDRGVGYEFLHLKCKDNSYPSREKLRRQLQTGTRKGADGRLVYKERVIDADVDQYQKQVIDSKTGEVIRMCKEPLSAHRGRGSAKGKEQK